MATRVRVTSISKNNRTPEILKALRLSRGSYVTVGVHKSAGQYPARPDGGEPPSVHKVAWWLEYGTENMPARPFMYPAVARNQNAIAKIAARSLAAVAYQKLPVKVGLATIGTAVVRMIQNVIKSNVGPALTGTWDPPSGYLGWRRLHYPESGQRTLIASGLLLRSVGFALHLKGAAAIQPGEATPIHLDQATKKARRETAIQEGAAMKSQRRNQRANARANKAATEAAFSAQKRVYTRAPLPTTPKKG